MANSSDTIDLDGATTASVRKPGTCSECGEPAWSPRATKCDKHRAIKSKRGATAPKDDTISVDKPAPAPPGPADDKGARIAQLKHSIIYDLNPVLVQGFATACRPVPADNFYTLHGDKVQPTTLGKEVELDGWSVELLARAAAELENSPILQSVKVVAGPFLPIAYGVGAAVAIALHASKTMTLRTQILKQWADSIEAQQQQAQAEKAQKQAAGPFADAEDQVA